MTPTGPGTPTDPGPLRLRAAALAVRYGGVVALDGVMLAVAPGEVVGLVGANGAGKTTLLDCLSGHLRPDRGAVRLGVRDVTGWGPGRRARHGVVRSFQDARLFPTMPVADVLRLARAPVPASLAGLRERRLEELSPGERKRVDLACALARGPRVLLLDEPTAGLAAAEVPGLEELLREVVAATGAAVVMVEHDLPMVWRLADRVAVLDRGRVVAEGAPPSLAGHPALAFGRMG